MIAPGSALPEDSDISAIIQSSSNSISNVASNSNATIIVLGGEDGNVADDILATGKAIVNGNEEEEAFVADPSDLAVTFISEGTSLEFSHVVCHFQTMLWESR